MSAAPCPGTPGQVIAILDEARLLGAVAVAGAIHAVSLACVAGERPLAALVGGWVLVHGPSALCPLGAEEAAAALDILEALGEAMAEIEGMLDHAAGAALA